MYNVHVKLVYQAPENVRDFSQKATFLFLVLDLNFMHLEMRAHVRECHRKEMNVICIYEGYPHQPHLQASSSSITGKVFNWSRSMIIRVKY